MRSGLSFRILAVASSALFLVLVVLAWGDWREFFANPARTGVIVITVLGTIAALFTDASLSPGKREDVANRWVLAPFLVGGFVVTLLPPYFERIDLWTFDGDAVRYAGLFVAAVGAALRIWPVFVLGHRFSGLVAIQENHSLVTTGPYRYIRHPSYLGALIFLIGWSFVFRTPIGIVFAALALLPLSARIDSEERLLASEFGAPYEDYRRRTWRLIPGSTSRARGSLPSPRQAKLAGGLSYEGISPLALLGKAQQGPTPRAARLARGARAPASQRESRVALLDSASRSCLVDIRAGRCPARSARLSVASCSISPSSITFSRPRARSGSGSTSAARSSSRFSSVASRSRCRRRPAPTCRAGSSSS